MARPPRTDHRRGVRAEAAPPVDQLDLPLQAGIVARVQAKVIAIGPLEGEAPIAPGAHRRKDLAHLAVGHPRLPAPTRGPAPRGVSPPLFMVRPQTASWWLVALQVGLTSPALFATLQGVRGGDPLRSSCCPSVCSIERPGSWEIRTRRTPRSSSNKRRTQRRRRAPTRQRNSARLSPTTWRRAAGAASPGAAGPPPWPCLRCPRRGCPRARCSARRRSRSGAAR